MNFFKSAVTACFLSLLSLPATAEWYGDVGRDAMTDLKNGTIFTQKNAHSRTALILRCVEERDIRIIVQADSYLSNSDVSIFYRVDKNEVVNSNASVSTEGTAIFISKSETPDLISLLEKGNILHVRVFDYQGTPHNYEFSLAGFTREFLENCGWHHWVKSS